MLGVQWPEVVERAAGAVQHAAQQRITHWQVARAVAGATPWMAYLAGAGQGLYDFNGKHTRAGNQALDIALRHQKQPVAIESHDFRFQL